MNTALAEALTKAGIPERMGMTPKFTDVQSKEKTQWHQIFKVTLTKFEVPILIKVRCDREDEGLKYIGSYKLNSIEATTQEEAKEKINQTLSDIQYKMKGTEPGCPLYFKFYN